MDSNGQRETLPLLSSDISNEASSVPIDTLSSLKNIIYHSKVNLLLIFIPLGFMADTLEWGDPLIFILNFLAILPLAKLLGYATEEIALKTNETFGGLLNATFGNAVEFIISVIALSKGEKFHQIIRSSLMGSILSNLLLVMGFCFLCGGLKYKVQTFNITAAQTGSSLMSLAVLSLMIPAAFQNAANSITTPNSIETMLEILTLSRGTSLVLLTIYCFYLIFQLKTHHNLYQDLAEADEAPSLTLPVSLSLLLVTTLVVAKCSDYMVDSLDGLSKSWHLSHAFVSVILIPIVGNAAEHVTAVTVAMKNKMNLAISVAIGSSIQIALFVTPLMVVIAWAMGQDFGLLFTAFETLCLFTAVLICNYLLMDGESNWLEGAMLLATYIILAISFLCLKD